MKSPERRSNDRKYLDVFSSLNTEDLEFGMHEFITYKIPDDEDDIDDAEEEGGDVSSEDEE